jgi:structural maintenance of chromosomes protein 5
MSIRGCSSKTHSLFVLFLSLDEINQGLDDRNERLVFKRIVKNSTRRPTGGDPTNHSGQYFLITPKLLPNLYDMEAEAVTVLVVFNGPKSFQSPTEWNVDNMLECSVEA